VTGAAKLKVRAQQPQPARRGEARKPKRQRGWTIRVETRPEPRRRAGPPLASLLEAAEQERRTPLPHRPQLEALFGADLSEFGLLMGPAVVAVLDAVGAKAAARGEHVLARSRAVDLPTLAHEVAHLLQAERKLTPARKVEVLPASDHAEVEAAEAARNATAAPGPDCVTQPAARLPAGVLALRRYGDAETEAAVTETPDRSDFRRSAEGTEAKSAAGEATSRAGLVPAKVEGAQGPAGTEPAAEAKQGEGGALGEAVPAAAEEPEAKPTFEPPPMPEVKIDTEAAAAKAEAAEATIAAADDADTLMAAFADAPPSVKAANHDKLTAETGELSQAEQATFQSNLPDFTAELAGGDTLPPTAPVQAPGGTVGALEEGTPEPAPEPEIAPTPAPAPAAYNEGVSDRLRSDFTAGDAESVGDAFSRIQTSDQDVDTSPGAPPTVPLEGECDPARAGEQTSAAIDEARAARGEAMQAVLDGPGPEQVQLRAMREAYPVPELIKPEIAAAPEGETVEGAAEFRDKKLDPEVVALFDADHDAAMRDSLVSSRAEMDKAVDDRNRERDASVATAETERDQLVAKANEDQRSGVIEGRTRIQEARQKAVDDQNAAVRGMEEQAELDRKQAESDIDSRVQEDEGKIRDQYADAEQKAKDEVAEGERKAEAERQRQEKEAEDQSWWDAAVDWVADQFDKLTSFINDVFDAVRSAVKGFFDAVKEAAFAIIDAAAGFIKDAIRGLGELLKAGVNALLADAFPEIAAALNEAIDAGVEFAVAVVDAVAEGLKTAVAAVVDTLAKAVDAIIAVYQAAVNAALALAKAALTGDWAALAKMILTPILKLLGIDPEAFYAYMAKIADVLGDIVDDPGGFLSNLVDAVLGGFQKFGDNFLKHLQAGIIAWLTGALGGAIQPPERWDLWGLLDIARQILGLTVEMLRKVAVRVLGEKAVEAIEFFLKYVTALITGGWKGLWDTITADLGNLADMVLDQIKSFLVERILIAAVTWLASLFNPVGAIIKLVMTIWNLICFLRDQLARIGAILKTIVDFMADIVKAVLEPAMLGVESVLANLLPLAIDLLARLLGLGNVGERTRKIIGDIHQKIEDAIVNLIKKVVAKFTGKGGAPAGEGAGAAKAPAGAGEIMPPIAIAAGGESHTLSILDQGEHVVAMLASAPLTVKSWIEERPGKPFEDLAAKKNWDDATKAKEKAELVRLKDLALKEEGLLDQQAEKAEDALAATTQTVPANQAAPAPQATKPVVDPQASAAVKQTAQQGQKTKTALEGILDFFGMTTTRELSEVFEADISKMRDPLAANLKSYVLKNLEAKLYSNVDWKQFAELLASDPRTTQPWRQPTSASGAARRFTDGKFDDAVLQRAEKIAKDPANGVPDGDTLMQKDEALDNLFAYRLAELLNKPEAVLKLVRRMLAPKNVPFTLWIKDIDAEIVEAVKKFGSPDTAPKPDFDIKDQIKGKGYYNIFVDAAKAKATTFKYYKDQKDDGTPGGTGVPKDLPWFLRPAGDTSPRNGANRGWVADQIRAAQPDQHEWVPASLGYAAIDRTAGRFKADGEVNTASGVADFIKFQNEVRTNTSELVFKPESFEKVKEPRIEYISPDHAKSGIPYDKLSTDQKNAFYPKTGPDFGASMECLQAHAGGLKARTFEGGALEWTFMQQASPQWHIDLTDRISEKVSGVVRLKEMAQIRDAILAFYQATVWAGDVDIGKLKDKYFDLYYITHQSKESTYQGMKAFAGGVYKRNYTALETKMNEVIGPAA
jgi:hypothetical protein